MSKFENQSDLLPVLSGIPQKVYTRTAIIPSMYILMINDIHKYIVSSTLLFADDIS